MDAARPVMTFDVKVLIPIEMVFGYRKVGLGPALDVRAECRFSDGAWIADRQVGIVEAGGVLVSAPCSGRASA